MNDIATRVEHLSKRYRIRKGQSARYSTLRDAITSVFAAPLHRVWNSLFEIRNPNFDIWALKDVCFEVKRGEVVGIIGRNGAGKTTLLKILSRITEPTEGYAEIHGRVGSLLEVGTGFHPELTGRENIYLNGAILGMKKAEIDRKFDEIVAFAELEKFIDTPVKFYSSGMYVRLAFAVAAHLEPEILLVDEVLAVGDVSFQRKCLGKMGDVAKQGRTVLFVSHNMPAISALCHKAMLLHNGELRLEEEPSLVIGHYLSEASKSSLVSLRDRNDRMGSGRLKFVSLQFRDSDVPAAIGTKVCSGHNIDIVLHYVTKANKPLRNVLVAIVFIDSYGQRLFTCSMQYKNVDFQQIPFSGQVVCHIRRFPLMPGDYSVLLWCSVNGDLSDRIEQAGLCHVEGGDFFGSGKLPVMHKHGPFLVDHEWHISAIGDIDTFSP